AADPPAAAPPDANAAPPGAAVPAPAAAPDPASLRVEVVASGLQRPWGAAVLPDGRLLVSERPGRLRLVTPDGSVSAPLAGVPQVHAVAEGGLLDVALSPTFAADATVYFSYAEPAPGGAARLAVASARLGDTGLSDLQVIFREPDPLQGSYHFGSRLVFAPDGMLFVTIGERYVLELAQQLSSPAGKVLRIAPDGSVPADNPFVATPNAMPQVYALGLRNPQGAAIHPQTGALWVSDHGPIGGDEINVVRAGRNYGWPRVSHGIHIDGQPPAEGTSAPDAEPPVYYWAPDSVATSGIVFHDGTGVPGWRGSLFVAWLRGQALVRLELDGERVVAEQRLLAGRGERIRHVRVAPDGSLLVLTDADDGRVLRISAP
ncbi:MAG TPA: PQQ-dependent sugar dehydrogenase, partial [Burkholderiaceae bacterium]|nr:PQQ-dependent sugar dehydrogenase [Burkholderiaceae bacterium]